MYWAVYRKDVRYLQYVAAVCVGILELAGYMVVSWVSPVIPLLTAEDSPIGVTLTNDEVAWVVATFALGSIPGSVLIGLLLDRIGPKCMLLLSAALHFVTWICLGLAKSMTLLVIGRIIGGVGSAIKINCFPIYICEIASKDIRGKLGTIPVLIGVLGNIFALAAGPYLGYIEFIIICAVFPVIFFFAFLFIPDSPYHLLKVEKRKEAQLSLTRFSSSSTSVDEIDLKLQEIEKTIRQDTGDLTLKESLCAPNFRKSLVIVSAAKIIVIFCGVTFVTTYIQVIAESSNTGLSTKMVSVIYGIIQIPSVLLSMLLLDKIGRKPVFCASSLGASLALLGEGAYLYLQDTVNFENFEFLPIFFLTLYKFSVSFGVLHLPYFILGELFTTKTKKVAAFIMSCGGGVLHFLNMKIFGSLFESWGIYTMCWIFGGVLILGIVFALVVLPETKGKGFNDIQNDLSSPEKD